MFAEIHRHFLLCKRGVNGGSMVYRQIILVERDQFELRVFDCETLELDPAVLGDIGELQLHDHLPLGILGAEKEYRNSVRRGWRALDANVPAYQILKARGAVA